MFPNAKFLLDRIKWFGRAPICNCRPDRGIWLKGFCFPLCVRCTAIIGTFLLFKFGFHTRFPIIACAILALPCAIDGVLQYFFAVESNAFRRVLTGFLFGIGIAGLKI